MIEKKYFSQSYFDDFRFYYVDSYSEADKYCKRIHFFSASKPNNFSDIELFSSSDIQAKEFWDSYRGYIVVRPIPRGLIGATLLAPPKIFNSNSRLCKLKFPAIIENTINIFGIQKTIQSIVYQEQDTMVGVCATAALWTAFDKLNHLYKTPIISPNQITKLARNSNSHPYGQFPNRGLDLTQIRNAVEGIGLEILILTAKDDTDISFLRGFIYAYLKMGNPIILGLEMNVDTIDNILSKNRAELDQRFELTNSESKNYQNLIDRRENFGHHAVTINGYCEPNIDEFREFKSDCTPSQKKAMIYNETIKNFLAHDDRVGPFAPIEFNGPQILTAWQDKSGNKINSNFFAVALALPKNIRVTYKHIRKQIEMFEKFIITFFGYQEGHYWEIYLQKSNLYKELVRGNKKSDKSLLFNSFPEIVWIASLNNLEQELIFEIIFDPTEIDFDFNAIMINFYDSYLKRLIKERFRTLFADYKNIILQLINVDPEDVETRNLLRALDLVYKIV